MKILMVNKFLYPKGGSETYIFELSAYLEEQGHEICFFGMHDEKNIVDMPESKLVCNVNFRKISFRSFVNPFKVIYSVESRRKIKKLIKEFQPDVVHLNNYNFQITPSILFEIKKHGIPMVQTLHDFVAICPASNLYNFRKGKVCEECKGHKYLNCIRGKCIHNSFIKSILGALEGYLYYKIGAYDYIDAFICPSSFTASKVAESGLDKARLEVLHNFIPQFNSKNRYIKKNYVLYFGRISEGKGLESLLKAVYELKHIKFVFAGSGPLVSELGKYENLEYVGFKTGEELKRLIAESLFTVYPSEFYENCPMSVLESQAMGTPVIASAVGGIPELVTDNDSGFLFKAEDVEDLINKINRLYSDRELLERFSSRCKEVMHKHSIEKYCAEITGIYERVESNRRN